MVFVSEFQRSGRIALNRIHNQLCKVDGSLSSHGECVVDCKRYSKHPAMVFKKFDFLLSISRISIDADYDALAETPYILNMPVQVCKSSFQSLGVGLLDSVKVGASMHLQSVERSDEHGQVGFQAAFATFDIIEFLCSEICPETSLRDGVVPECHRCFRGDY